MQHDEIPFLVGASLNLPPNYEFDITGLAEYAGVTRQTVKNYTDLLINVEIINEISKTSPRRYRVVATDGTRELFQLNSTLNNVRE